MSEFYQNGPVLGNQYDQDAVLREYLEFRVPKSIFTKIEPGLRQLGERAAKEFWDLENSAERDIPEHIPYSPWGERIDEVRVSPAWQRLHEIAAEEGMIATGYERKDAEYSRLHQFVRLYLFHPSSAFYTCPLAMTDGAAKLLEVYGEGQFSEAFANLTSRDPDIFWTSGQWMTEKSGGSDVSGTETIAKPDGQGNYRLYGTKWFSSATTARMAMALARVEGDVSGSRGLSVFYLKMHDAQGKLNGIRLNRLKDKLGTKALPTAELTLEGARAQLVGKQGAGVGTIAALFNITRIYNAICALGTIRRALYLAKDYAEKRQAFGKFLSAQPLHVETLASLELEHAAALHLTMHLCYLLGKEEVGKASNAEVTMLRMLTPIAKLYTGKKAVTVTSEAIECIGGAAYIEDTGIPRLLRNAQVFPIWEGTTNILSLDVLRAIDKENAFTAFVQDIKARLAQVKRFPSEKSQIETALQDMEKFLQAGVREGKDFIQAGARSLAFSLARTMIASLFLEFAEANQGKPQESISQAYVERWFAEPLVNLQKTSAEYRQKSTELLFR